MNTKIINYVNFNLSQEEIDALIEEMHKEQSGQMEMDFKYDPNSIPKSHGYVDQDGNKKECDHSWKTYQGLNESFDFCEFCDVKK